MWDLDTGGQKVPWRADDYLFGVWELLAGKEAEGYAHLEECVKFHTDYMTNRLEERSGAYNDPREPIAVMYHNAQLFVRTKQTAGREKRQNAIQETYEEVCQFMRCYHGLAKKTERD